MRLTGFDVRSATVRCEPSGQEVPVVRGTTLIDAIVAAGLPLGQSCDGVGLCGFCHVRILGGGGSLSPAGEAERKTLAAAGADPSERLACCTRVEGDVTVTTSYW